MYRVYYPDGSTLDGNEGDAPPPLDAQVIVQKDTDRGWITTHGADFYVRKDGRWWGVDEKGLDDYCIKMDLIKFNDSSHKPVLISVDGKWQPATIWQMFRYLMGTGLVLFGETIPHSEFDEIYQKAKVYKQRLINAQSSI